MAFDAHKNFAYSTVLTAPSPASSGTSLVVQSADGTKFPAVPFNATIWPAGAQPTTANAEIVRVTAVSTDTFTITRTREGSSARTVVVGDQIAASITAKTVYDVEGGLNGGFDYIISGCVWTADSAGSTRAASMTAGSIWLNGVQLTVAAVSARSFTASKDVYVDFSDNGDGTALLTYTDTTTNAASPALTAGSLRNAIVVVGASSIAAAASINQGQETRVLPIASSIPYTVTDSLGNLICPRDPNRKLLGYRQVTASLSATTIAQAVGLSVPIIAPTGRKIKVSIGAYSFGGNNTNSTNTASIWDGVVNSGTEVGAVENSSGTAGDLRRGIYNEFVITPSATSKTYNVGLAATAGTCFLTATATRPAYIKVELE